MIESTFCHLPRVSLAVEKDLWRKGVRDWNELLCRSAIHDDDTRYRELEQAVARSHVALALQNAAFFLSLLPESEWFRIYPDFRSNLRFLDIETDGLAEDATITCLSVMDAGDMVTFTEPEGLDGAREVLTSSRIVVTFHGIGFDIPRLMRRFPEFCPRYQLDLARILRRHKIHGTLKDVASRFGWRSEARDGRVIADGREAAMAWRDFSESRNPAILEAICRYNQEDVRRLEFVLGALARRHLRGTAC